MAARADRPYEPTIVRATVAEAPCVMVLEEVYETERHLLYVASSRARDRLLITGVLPGSEFLYDLG